MNVIKMNGAAHNALAIEDEHIATSPDSPIRDDAFEMGDELKIQLIQNHFKEIMYLMGLDLTDDSLKRNTAPRCKNVCKRSFQRIKSCEQTGSKTL